MAETIEMREMLLVCGNHPTRSREALPEPSVPPKPSGDELVTLVDIDFSSYRRAHDYVLFENLTIPSWLNAKLNKLASLLPDPAGGLERLFAGEGP